MRLGRKEKHQQVSRMVLTLLYILKELTMLAQGRCYDTIYGIGNINIGTHECELIKTDKTLFN